MIIAIDFDGTIVSHLYPKVGKPNPGAIETMKALQARGHKLILWTMRDGTELVEAVAYCNENGIRFWGINKNPEQHEWTNSNKQYAQMYIDDAALGCPLAPGPASPGGRPWADWVEISRTLKNLGIL